MTDPSHRGAVRDTEVRYGRRRRVPWWLFLLGLMVVLAVVAVSLVAALHGGGSNKVTPPPGGSLKGGSAAATLSHAATPVGVPPEPATTPSSTTEAGVATALPGGPASVVATGNSTGASAASPVVGGLVGGASVSPAPATGSFAAGDTLGTVLFAENSAALTSNARTVISHAAAAVKTDHLSTVVISGYTDQVAGRPSNLTLSRQRADNVLGALKADVGPGVTTYRTRDHGESDPIATNSTAAGRQQNRRATITTD